MLCSKCSKAVRHQSQPSVARAIMTALLARRPHRFAVLCDVLGIRIMPTAAAKPRKQFRAERELRASVLKEMNRHRLAHLATADRQGKPLVVPLCFACHRNSIYSVVDEKPKKVSVSRLRRLRNITDNPQVALLVDHYEEDWSRLSYILVEGRARALHSGHQHASALRLLRSKYPQYQTMQLEDKPVIKISPRRVIYWKAK